MPFWQTYLVVSAGILFSIIIPIVREAVPKPDGLTTEGFLSRVGKAARPYIAILILSLLTAFLVIAGLGELPDWKAALLAGFAWESFLEKVRG